MTRRALIETAVRRHCAAAFLEPDELMRRAMAGAQENPPPRRRVPLRRSFVAAVAAALLLAALSLTVLAAALGLIPISGLLRQFGVSPAAYAEEGRAAIEPYLYDQMLRWNFFRAEQGLEPVDPDAVLRDFQDGRLTLEGLYRVFGAEPISPEAVEREEARAPRLLELEEELERGKDRYRALTARRDGGERLTGAENEWLVGYALSLTESGRIREEISGRLSLEAKRAQSRDAWSRTIPARYRCRPSSGYRYLRPFGERDGLGQLIPHDFIEMAATGHCCYDGGVYDNTAAISDFADRFSRGESADLVVYEKGAAVEYRFDGTALLVRRTRYLSDGSARAWEYPALGFRSELGILYCRFIQPPGPEWPEHPLW